MSEKENQSVDLFGNIKSRDIGEEMKRSYIDYAMSVIVGRALPDVRDGLKPIHRRLLYGMNEMGLKYNKSFKKSARVVGDVMGKYHPHGDSAIYDSLVRLAQDFSLRDTLVDGQGNFGSVDGDMAAAMRYTEVRLERIADEMLNDIDKNTVKFMDNYDGSMQEPSVLPAKMPNLLVNGSSGIAVGMATNIPTHNLSEVCDAVIEVIKNPGVTTKELMNIIKGPDFPTGAIICGRKGIFDYFETGKGSVKVQARAEIEEGGRGGRSAIVVTEIPYQVNKTNLIEAIAGLVKDKKVTDIADIRDESDRRGMRLVIEVKRDGDARVVLNHLYKHTQLQTSFSVNMLAIVDGRPRILPIKEVMKCYVKHRKEVVTARTRFDLNKAQKREHILQGLLIAIANLDKVIKIIREAQDPTEAKFALIREFALSEPQSQAILDMRLHQLTQLSSASIEKEQKELLALIAELKGILEDPQKVLAIIVDELKGLKKDYGTERKTEISNTELSDMTMEDLIEEEDVVITLSNDGYAKRIPLDTYRTQNRGGKGVIGGKTKEEDFIEHLFVTSTHATILMFTTRGRVFSLRAYEIPEGNRLSKGKAIVNLLQISNEEKITSAVAIEDFDPKNSGETYLTMCTRFGLIKRVELGDFANIRKSGIIAIGLEDGDVLTSVQMTHGKSDLIIATRDGKAIRFDEEQIRAMGRQAKGVRGIRLGKDDIVVGMEHALKDAPGPDVLSVCENGYGKRTEFTEYRKQNRGGSGTITIKTTERNGKVVGIKLVDESKDLMVITENGMAVRIRCEEIRSVGRNAQGVRLVKLAESDKIARIAPVIKDNDEEACGGEEAVPKELI
ncbi:DNA gyrase, A subunit [Elusimicrobium minutum Pei191]|uniref:DNA gyrase subunit A n=1 Tax=Elusimicrobium minutum (strain Pei191) TaxID=445932 RepID=B2KAM8_ELUMP|nr:DNA gyrase subunit A [Elusimicrobium minutum]ACC97574.1 DNA gyrase, A subunit [Elusimicrobium minutum Pei191]